MEFLSVLSPILNLARDMAFVCIYAGAIDSDRKPAWWRRPAALAELIVLNTLLLIIGNSSEALGTVILLFESMPEAALTLLRAAIRFISCFLYIRLLKKISLNATIYDALLISTVCIINHNIFLTPLTRPFISGNVNLTGNALCDRIICLILINLVSAFIYFIVYKAVPVRDIKNINRSRALIIVLMLLASQFLNSTIKLIYIDNPVQGQLVSVYVIAMQLMLIAFLSYIEGYHRVMREQNRTALENQAVISLLENIEKQEKNDDMVRQMRHDLRNHMISLLYLMSDGKYDDAADYVRDLSREYVSFKPRVKTGNSILDGILVQKMDKAADIDTGFSISADFSFLEPVKAADLCILFGNILDNALEACAQVPPGQRYISIRAVKLGESIIYYIDNSFCGNIKFAGDAPVTTKTDSHKHGIGLNSVKRVIRKYDGTIAFSAADGQFSAIISFPVPLPQVTD